MYCAHVNVEWFLTASLIILFIHPAFSAPSLAPSASLLSGIRGSGRVQELDESPPQKVRATAEQEGAKGNLQGGVSLSHGWRWISGRQDFKFSPTLCISLNDPEKNDPENK